ncbi:hypothetical protein EPUS_08047 [Endocarpon pusillum Z07020]|uniref:Cytochrome P450 n=1 Tax=Endocarpon pusillum (strain Z07020 / HMAS-L-300199) TaxID=1263415 RepID=U1GBR6_ENDPU|nr:uncharacterized protein EPUS_08047 [Endocarpon pusillum Z07020]ERF75002.1 hypothetical protein EPUS_08047 [Endocarpon pusillum Z07020]
MSSFSIPLLVKLLPLLISAYVYWRKFQPPRSQGNPLPGPAGLPIIGNAFQFPKKNPWKQLKVWADEYGPIYRISALGKTFIVLGSEEVCNDLLRARGDIYSDRHYITVLRDEIHLPIIKYGDTWRRQRKFFHFAQLQSHASNPHYIAALNQNVRRTLDEFLATYSTTPSQTTTTTPSTATAAPPPTLDLKTYWHHILEAYICGVVSQLAYGYEVKSSSEKYVRDWVGFYNEFEKAAEPARYAVNACPWLRFVPRWLGPWKESGKEYLRREREMIHRMFFGVGERMGSALAAERNVKGEESGSNGAVSLKNDSEGKKTKQEEPWSISKLYFLNPSKWTNTSSTTSPPSSPSTTATSTSLTPHEAAYTLGAYIEASMAGTPAALKLLFQAMLWYPEWQSRIYEEICQVCGRVSSDTTQRETGSEQSPQHPSSPGRGDEEKKKPRMPDLSDMPRLPIIRAVLKETLRWRPTLPGGFPHRLTRDDLYTPATPTTTTTTKTPYLLKKGSLLLWHHYTLTRNAVTYPSPEAFNPTRFLSPTLYPQTTRLPLSLVVRAFGFGRRVCPGTRMAEDMMVLCVAWVVCAAEIGRKEKTRGRGGRGWMHLSMCPGRNMTRGGRRDRAGLSSCWWSGAGGGGGWSWRGERVGTSTTFS